MSTGTPPAGDPPAAPAATPPAMPTAADAQAIFEQAAAAARQATDAASQAEAARVAAASEAGRRFEGMPREVVDNIAGAAATQVVAMLREEFELKGAPGPPTSPSASPGSALTASSAASAPGADSPPASTPPPAPSPGARKTLAERLLGY